MLTFRGGREVQGYPVSNAQTISEINESLGLGIEQFMVGKKIDMLDFFNSEYNYLLPSLINSFLASKSLEFLEFWAL